MSDKDKTAKLRAELSDLASKVRDAGRAGCFVNWTPAYRRAQKVLKETKDVPARRRKV